MKLIIKDKKTKELIKEIKILKEDNNKYLLSFFEKQNFYIPSACNFWLCWACKCNIKNKNGLILEKSEYPLDKNEILACKSKINFWEKDILILV